MFDYFVSLGYSCPTASSMSKYGLRSFSGLFDWLISADFSWVLHFIETDFTDFLQKDRLELFDNHLKKFRDTASGFVFLHDAMDYRTEFPALKEKYDRRIQRFLAAARERTCFLRSVANQEELNYVQTHAAYVREVIGKGNRQSEIVFLLRKEWDVPKDFPFRAYQMMEAYDVGSKYRMRTWFDGSSDFLEFCGQRYSGYAMMKNLMFDNKGESLEAQLADRRYRSLAALSVHDFSKDTLPPEIMIYGAGRLGRALHEKIRPYSHIKCFFDRNRCGTEFRGTPIRSLDELESGTAAVMVVSTTYDFEAIQEAVQARSPGITVISLDDLTGLRF